VRAEEINALIEKREYAEAVKIADTIDWRRVKSVTMLCKVSELYKMNRRYEDSKEILLLAYDRQPGSRKIVYSLCELCIKLEELVQAIEYYKEFVQIAPKDTGRFILQYRLYEAQDVSLEERIAVLEEYKKRDYREKWAYELAYLYHRIGLATRCVEECDELILWFGEGKYVIKAMELKMLHVPLTPTQQEKYDKRFQTSTNAYVVNTEETQETPKEEEQPVAETEKETVSTDTIPSMPIQIKSVEVSNAPTMRIPSREVDEEVQEPEEEAAAEPEEAEEISIDMPEIPLAPIPDDLDIQVKPLDMGEYNTINLQKELAHNLAKIMEQEDMEANDATKTLPVDSINNLANDTEEEAAAEAEEAEAEIAEEPEESEIETVEEPVEEVRTPLDFAVTKEVVDEVVKTLGTGEQQPITEEDLLNSLNEQLPEAEELAEPAEEPETLEEAEPSLTENAETEVTQEVQEQPVTEEQVMKEPEQEAVSDEVVDEQITGQLSFEDIMAEWEETKKANEAKRLEEMRRKVLEQTGPMFQDYDAAAKASVQADLDLIAPTLDVFDKQEDQEVEPEETTSEETMPEAPVIEEAEKEPEFNPTVFNTAEINGLEEKLVSTLYEQEEETVPDEEDDSVEELEDIIEDITFEQPQEAEEKEAEVEEAEEIEEFEEISIQTEEAVEEEPAQKPGSQTEEFDKSLEKLVLEALQENERKAADKPKGDTGFIITDLTEEEEAVEKEPEILEEPTFSEEQTIPVRRTLTRDEKEMFGSIAQTKQVQEEVANAIDNVSLNPCIGNVLITGEKGTGTLAVAKNLIKVLSVNEDEFSGKVAKITGELLNNKSIEETVNGLSNGALIVEQAGKLDEMSLLSLGECLKKKREDGILILLEDTAKGMDGLLEKANMPKQFFDLRIDIAALDNDGLVNYGKEYANEQEYSIDDMGVLALYTRIADMQTNEHAVTVEEVRELVDEAIRNSEKKNISHFMDVLLAKRYDDEDMIVLREKDFLK
jgi:tetratricopeptide (TPR) repeat protein